MIEFVAEILFRVICGLTGHLILWVLSFGRWDISNGRDDTATVVGILVWVAVVVGVWLIFFR